MRVRNVGLCAVLIAGIACGALSVAIAHAEPAYSFAGEFPVSFAGEPQVRATAELFAGWALLAVGLVAWVRRGSGFGALLVAGSFGWFLLEWNNAGIGSALGFALGLTLYAAAPPLMAHAALLYPGRRLSSRLERLVLAAAYGGAILILGLGPALVFDPTSGVCTECPRNLLLVEESSRLYDSLIRIGVQAGLAWSLALVLLLVRRLAQASPALRRVLWPVLVPAAAYLGLVAWTFAAGLEGGKLGNSPIARDLWLGQAAALVALALGVVWGWLRARHTRAAIARLVVEVAASPEPGGLREKLARMLHDESVEVAYPLEDGGLVDALGRPLALGGQVTPLVREGETVALLSHRPGLLDDPALAEEVVAAARLALENERLQAEVQAQLEQLRRSRARVIATGDAERRRLERDLHDGAQQRLVGLSLQLGLMRSRLGPQPDAATVEQIDEAEAELGAALAGLREVGHGLFPALLAEEGLAVALEALTEEAPVEIEIGALPQRLDGSVEAAAYFVVSEALKRSRSIPERLAARTEGDLLVVEVEADIADSEIVGLGDRVGAAGGTLEVVREADGRARIRMEIPCGL
jgi:signal transduction histidine kinase